MHLVHTWTLFPPTTTEESDGILLVKDQKFDQFGVDLGVLNVDHVGLTVISLFSKTSEADRKAFTRTVLDQVYQPKPLP
jgi:hypothetical protein